VLQTLVEIPPKVGHSLQETFMSFKVGDVCIFVDGGPAYLKNVSLRKYIGMEVTVSGPAFSTRPDEHKRRIEFGEIEVTPRHGRPFDTHPNNLRPIGGKSDEFQPAEPEFVSDLLKRLNKVKV